MHALFDNVFRNARSGKTGEVSTCVQTRAIDTDVAQDEVEPRREKITDPRHEMIIA